MCCPFYFLASLTFITTLFFTASAAAPPHYLKLPLSRETPQPPPNLTLAADLRRISAFRSHPKLPVTSIAASGTGQYSVTLHLGTPPRRLRLVADSGSDLTWVSCSLTRHRSSAAYVPRASSSFRQYHCYESTCKLVPRPKNAPTCSHARLHSSCPYEYKYADGSVTRGVFATETTTFNGSSTTRRELLISFKRLSFGCGFSNSGPSVSGLGFDGVLGLGRGPISLPSQMGRAFGHKFSYCLMDYTLSPPPTSYLVIGGDYVRNAKFSYTPLLLNNLSPTFYYIGINRVSINNVKLPINPSTWAIDGSGNGGTVVDSGTTLTFLPEPAYKKIVTAFDRLVKLPRSTEPGLGFDLCVKVSGGSRGGFPRLSFELDGGSIFSPPPGNYFIDVAEDVVCLALQPVASAAHGFSIVGNLMQQGYTFEFDVARGRLGFTRYGCSVSS